MLVELPAGSWGNLMKAFQDQYGTSIPPKELPAQSYFEVLEEMVQDRVFNAESLAQVVSLDTENKHRLANPETHSQHIAMLFDGSTIRPKRRLVSSMPEDLEGFRAKYEIIANVWRMMKLRSPGRAVLAGLTENTWDTHRKSLMDSKRFAMELEVAPGVFKAPGWHMCLSYELKVREAAMDLIRMQCLPSAEALDRVRNDQEHRMIHWDNSSCNQESKGQFQHQLPPEVHPAQPNGPRQLSPTASPQVSKRSRAKLTRSNCSQTGLHQEVKSVTDPDLRGFRSRVPEARLAKAEDTAVHRKAKAKDPVSKIW